MIPQENIQKTYFFSETSSSSQRISIYSLLAHIYFFFNSVFLPKGILFTTILSPVFFFNQIKNKRKTFAFSFFSVLFLYDFVHLYSGVDFTSFIISNGLFISTYFFVISFYHFINLYGSLSKLFKQILVFNFFLALISVPFLFMETQYQNWLWWVNQLTKGITNFPRLKLFTYEASYYALLFVPIFFYYIFKLLFNDIQNNKKLTMIFVFTPLILSMSFGVIGATLITALVMSFIFIKKLLKFQRAFILTCSCLLITVAGFVFAVVFFPTNPILIRIFNILEGSDTSANGRIGDSYAMAWRIAELKSLYFGAGLGQVKIQTFEVVRKYFNYWGEFPRYDIPNTMGETLAIFGIFGVVLRLFLEIYLFFKTKVFSNYYRLALFIFVFIYQFTGSFITNIVEYVIWTIAFSNAFEQFNIKKETA